MTNTESVSYTHLSNDEKTEEEDSEPEPPKREEVLAARELALEDMSEEEAERLTENIKTTNLVLEQAYMYDNIFGKLEDKDSLYWNYFDQTGEIQIGWAYEGDIDKKEVMKAMIPLPYSAAACFRPFFSIVRLKIL